MTGIQVVYKASESSLISGNIGCYDNNTLDFVPMTTTTDIHTNHFTPCTCMAFMITLYALNFIYETQSSCTIKRTVSVGRFYK